MDWSRYPNFIEDEFRCSHTGRVDMQPEFMERLQSLRTMIGAPLEITSGYRDVTHPVEAAKERGGVHTKGIACDIACDGRKAYLVVKFALALGFTGVGVSQKGSRRFIHLDIYDEQPRPNLWSY